MNSYLEQDDLLGQLVTKHIGSKNFYEHGMGEGVRNRYSLEEDINTLEFQDWSLSSLQEVKEGDFKGYPSVSYSFVGDVELNDLKSVLMDLNETFEENQEDGLDTTYLKNQLKSLSRVVERFSFSGDTDFSLRETNQSRNPNTIAF